MIDRYILVDKVPKPAANMEDWAIWFGTTDRHVAETIIGDVRVSTVFLGLDHGFGRNEPPILFETMIFGGEHDQYCERCSTWEEAEAMHAKAVALVKGELIG